MRGIYFATPSLDFQRESRRGAPKLVPVNSGGVISVALICLARRGVDLHPQREESRLGTGFPVD